MKFGKIVIVTTLASILSSGCTSIVPEFEPEKQDPIWEYAKTQGVEYGLAKKLSSILEPLRENDKELLKKAHSYKQFIDLLADSSSVESQREILDKILKPGDIYEFLKINNNYESAKELCEKFLNNYENAESNLKIIAEKTYAWQNLVSLQVEIEQKDQLVNEVNYLWTPEDIKIVKRRDKIRDKLEAEGESIWGGKPTQSWWTIKFIKSQITLDKAVDAYINANQNLVSSYENLIRILESQSLKTQK